MKAVIIMLIFLFLCSCGLDENSSIPVRVPNRRDLYPERIFVVKKGNRILLYLLRAAKIDTTLYINTNKTSYKLAVKPEQRLVKDLGTYDDRDITVRIHSDINPSDLLYRPIDSPGSCVKTHFAEGGTTANDLFRISKDTLGIVNSGDNTISFVRLTDQKFYAQRTIETYGVNPFRALYDNGYIYVTLFVDNRISVIDPLSGEVLSLIDTPAINREFYFDIDVDCDNDGQLDANFCKRFIPRHPEAIFGSDNKIYVSYVNFLRRSRPENGESAYFGPGLIIEYSIDNSTGNISSTGRYIELPFKNPQAIVPYNEKELMIFSSGTIDFQGENNRPQITDDSGIVFLDRDTFETTNIKDTGKFGPGTGCIDLKSRAVVVGSLVVPEIMIINEDGEISKKEISEDGIESIFSTICLPYGIAVSTVFSQDKLIFTDTIGQDLVPFEQVKIGTGMPLFQGPIDLVLDDRTDSDGSYRLFFLMGIDSSVGYLDLACLTGFFREDAK